MYLTILYETDFNTVALKSKAVVEELGFFLTSIHNVSYH
jgi:hypothetical protein